MEIWYLFFKQAFEKEKELNQVLLIHPTLTKKLKIQC